MKENKILIIDAHNAFIRSYVVDPSETSDGQPNGGYKGFMKQIQRYLKEAEPDEVYVVWDGTGGSKKRRAVNKQYKEGRKPVNPLGRPEMSPEEKAKNRLWQVRTLISHLDLTPVRQLMVNDIEADDVIAILAKAEEYRNDFKIILSNDKDFYQLLDSKTIVWRPGTDRMMTTKDVVEDFSIHPHNMTIARSLVGDTSDNLPGVKGMGLKSVVKFFPEARNPERITLDEVFSKGSVISGKYKVIDALLESEEIVRSNYRIMQLQTPEVTEEHTNIIQSSIDSERSTFKKILFDAYVYKHELDDVRWDFMRSYFEKLGTKT